MLLKIFCFRFSRKILIPVEKLEMNFSRSSGPGGQNVNKLNTKVDLRFHVATSDWMTEDCKKRLFEDYPNRINNEGFFIITSQEHRTQEMNKKEAISKLQSIIELVRIPKKERVIAPIRESVVEEEKRISDKKRRSETKNFRRNTKDDNFRL
jgi:peptidyl-tRNA hydrolase ICT1